MQSETINRDYEYGPAEKRGYLLGLQPLQIAALGATALGVIFLLLTNHNLEAVLALVSGLVAALLPTAPQPPFVLTVHNGRPMLVLQDGRPPILWLPLIWSWARRRLSGNHRWASAMHLDQVVVLSKWGSPGEAVLEPEARNRAKERRRARRLQPESVRGLQILSVTGFGQNLDVGIVFDPAEKTYAAFVALMARDYALLAEVERVRLNDLWGGIFERYEAAASPVGRVQVIERTIPEDGEAMSRAYQEFRVEGEMLDKAHESYSQLVGQAAPLAQRHECYVGIKVDLKRLSASREAKRQGGGNLRRGACLLVLEEIGVLIQNLGGAELTVLGALPPRLLAEVVRFGYDPEQRGPSAERERARPPEEEEGLEPARAWPSYTEERLAHYRADGGFHITGHVREWPRSRVTAGFLQPLLLETSCMRTVSLVYEVRAPEVARKEFRASATNDSITQRIRERWGQRDTPERQMQRENVLRAEREAAEGHAVIAWSGYVTVSGHTLVEAEDAWAEAVSRASASNLELQRLYGLQEAAFTYSLPLARGL